MKRKHEYSKHVTNMPPWQAHLLTLSSYYHPNDVRFPSPWKVQLGNTYNEDAHDTMFLMADTGSEADGEVRPPRRWRKRAEQFKVGRASRAPCICISGMAWPCCDIEGHSGGGSSPLARRGQPMAYRRGKGSVVTRHGCQWGHQARDEKSTSIPSDPPHRPPLHSMPKGRLMSATVLYVHQASSHH
jgi:hypothetical protein